MFHRRRKKKEISVEEGGFGLVLDKVKLIRHS